MFKYPLEIAIFLTFALLMSACGKAAFDAEAPAHNLDNVSESLSTMVVTEGNIADGITPAYVTITLMSRMGAPVIGEKMDLTVSGSNNVVIPCGRSNSAGLIRCTVYSTHAEAKDLKAVGKVSLKVSTVFKAANPVRSSFSFVSAANDSTLPSGHRVITIAGLSESPSVQRDQDGIVRIGSSILTAVITE